MQAKAEAKYIRISPRKVRLVVDLVRGMGIEEARLQLEVSPKLAAKAVLKVLNSAVANAQHNLKADTTDFRVLTAYVNEGPKMMRYKPRAQGRATPIRKRMSHIGIVVGNDTEVEATSKKAEAPKAEAKKPAAKKAPAKKTATKKEAPKKVEASDKAAKPKAKKTAAKAKKTDKKDKE